MTNKLISIITPAYNEEGNIEAFAHAVKEECMALCQQNSKMDYELIFIDDGSNDGSLSIIKALSDNNQRIHYVSFSRNFGHQAALKAGLDFAKGDAVISLDADLQHPVDLIPHMIEKWREGYDVVYTLRQDDEKLSLFKKMTSHCFYKIISMLSTVSVPDGAADFRLCDRKVVEVLKSFQEPFLFWRGLVVWSGFRQTAITYKPLTRKAGTSKYTIGKMFNLAMNGISSFSVRPLHICTVLGFIALLTFLIMLTTMVILTLCGQNAFSPFSIIILIQHFQFSLLMLCLGILGTYVGKTFMMGQRRPIYIIKESK